MFACFKSYRTRYSVLRYNLNYDDRRRSSPPPYEYRLPRKLISESSLRLLNEWNCSSNIYGMVFDTTALNTGRQLYLHGIFAIPAHLSFFIGHKTAACVSF